MNIYSVIDIIAKEIERSGVAQRHGFQFSSSILPSRTGTGQLSKQTCNSYLEFGFGILDEVDNFRIGHSQGFVTFHNVEKITIPVLVKNNILGDSALNGIPTFFPPQPESRMVVLSYKNENDLHLYIQSFLNHFEKIIIPALNEYEALETINELLNNTPQKEVEKSIPCGVYVKATIWKLCKNPRYDEYINWLVEGMTNRVNNDPSEERYTNSAKAIVDLKRVLSNY